MHSKTRFWLGLNLVRQLGSIRIQQLIAHFNGDPELAWNAKEHALKQAGLQNRALAELLHARRSLNLDIEMQKVYRAGAHLVTMDEDVYPKNLAELPDAPPVLYVRGSLLPTDVRALAIVGTRRATRYGYDAAHRMGYWLANQGVTIVSGLALGIDSAAHQGALEADGRTIAVLGCGIDTIYPPENHELATRIIEQGAIISELPVGVPPTGSNFPRRNRIISGLSSGVMIAEAPERSGAIITAEAALEQGREVFAIPANIFNPMGTGTNRLIQEGAKLVMRASDVLDELNINYTKHETRVKTRAVAPDTDIEKQLLHYIETDPIHIDELIRISGLSTEEVTATLTILELKGLAQMVGQMQYCRTR